MVEKTTELAFDQLSQDDHLMLSPNMEDEIQKIEIKDAIGRALNKLSPRECMIIRKRFGMDKEIETSRNEIATTLCLSVERVVSVS